MMEREEIRAGKRVTVVERDLSPDELERQDLLNRVAALEAEAKARNPNYKVPDPPLGHKRRM